MSMFGRSKGLFRLMKCGRVVLLRTLATQTPRLRAAVKKSNSFGDGGYILLIIPAAAFALGTWQIQRREWKLGLIEELEAKTTEAPVPLPLDLNELSDMEYRHVTVRGKFSHSREMLIGPRSNVLVEKDGGFGSTPSTGVNVITPFILSDRDLTILVNRGWVPPKHKNPATRKKGQIEDEIEITGLVRHDDEKNPMVPAGNYEKDGYFLYRSIPELAEKGNTAPVFIDADRKSSVDGGPLGGQTRVTLRNEHLAYIITWYLLAGFTFWMWFKRYRRPPPPDSAFNYIKKHPGP